MNDRFDLAIKGPLALDCGVSKSTEYETSFERAKDADLGRLADCLTRGEMQGKNVAVVGHGDVTRTNDRVDAVAAYLEGQGVPKARIQRIVRDDGTGHGNEVELEVSN